MLYHINDDRQVRDTYGKVNFLLGKEKRFFKNKNKNKKFTCRRQAKKLLKIRQIPLSLPLVKEVRKTAPYGAVFSLIKSVFKAILINALGRRTGKKLYYPSANRDGGRRLV